MKRGRSCSPRSLGADARSETVGAPDDARHQGSSPSASEEGRQEVGFSRTYPLTRVGRVAGDLIGCPAACRACPSSASGAAVPIAGPGAAGSERRVHRRRGRRSRGTLGCFLDSDGVTYLLSADHVLTPRTCGGQRRTSCNRVSTTETPTAAPRSRRPARAFRSLPGRSDRARVHDRGSRGPPNCGSADAKDFRPPVMRRSDRQVEKLGTRTHHSYGSGRSVGCPIVKVAYPERGLPWVLATTFLVTGADRAFSRPGRFGSGRLHERAAAGRHRRRRQRPANALHPDGPHSGALRRGTPLPLNPGG
jgi:hypothetical protein